ncbi:hypothetical protein DRJ19_03530 [Candidatus Woesearchaeota archaeon]|nr:MAG: hypothetical protein DRJ19_03530 [Candidatus Woesearchaeota archaeon]
MSEEKQQTFAKAETEQQQKQEGKTPNVVTAALVFFIAAVLVASLGIILFKYSAALLSILPILILIAILLFIAAKFEPLVKLKEYQRAVVFRFGKFNRVSGPGWFFIIPFIESYNIVDLRVQTVDIPPQEVITKGNIEVKVDAVIYMRVGSAEEDVVKSVVKVEDYKKAAQLYVGSTLRDIAGDLTLAELIANIDKINEKLKQKLQLVSQDWGVKVDAVEIKDIQIPKEVLDAMHAEKAAEQRKLARMEEAKAHMAEIQAVKEAAKGLDEKALLYYYIRALEKMSTGKATTIIFPLEVTKLASILSSAVGKATSQPKIEELILKEKDSIANLLGKKFAESLAEVAKEEKKTKKKKTKKKKSSRKR